MKTFFCQITKDRLPELKVGLPVIKEFLQPDYLIVVDGGSTDGSLEFLSQLGAIIIEQPFRDFVMQRNAYLDLVEELADEGDLMVVSDTDEYLAPPLLAGVKNIAEDAWDQDANLLTVRCRSEWIDKQGRLLYATLDDYHKPLISIWEPGARYLGAGGTPIHEELYPRSGRRFMHIDDQGGLYVYRHVKRLGIVYPRALRNLWFSPYGPDGVRVPYWEAFKDMLIRHGMNDWASIERRFEIGSIPSEIKDWLIEHRNDPYSEVKSSFKAYYLWWHPEDLPNGLAAEHAEEIEKIHGHV